jgi:heme-degrading monooxygenase HmoA
MVSRLELARLRHVPGFLVAALRLRRDVRRAPGALGVSLRARPTQRTFWTLSSWTDAEAMAAFTRSPAHVAVMRAYHDRMLGSQFHTWGPPVGAGAPDWADALARLDAAA